MPKETTITPEDAELISVALSFMLRQMDGNNDQSREQMKQVISLIEKIKTYEVVRDEKAPKGK